VIEYPSERAARLAMVEIGRRLYARALINGGEGNLSCRLGPRRLLCTPAGVNKGFLSEDQLVVTDLDGEAFHELRKPSSELLLHLACYEERDDCVAVVHAHPPHAVALTLAGEELLPCMPEAVTALARRDRERYAAAIGAIVADFERRPEHLTGVAIADTALCIEVLASSRGLASGVSSPLLPE